ncbi:MAG TPA: 50S ribosomal protein L34e [Thermoprotei archaeon]|nr:50S ribosomal protein L34e [Thermoprotei archaeon]
MPKPSQRSQVKIKMVRTPGGRLVIHYLKKKVKIPRCSLCKKPLNGFPNSRKKIKYHRPPNRIYGGYLCSNCLRLALKRRIHALILQTT